MKGSEFLDTFAQAKPANTASWGEQQRWEAAAVKMAENGDTVSWPWVEVPLTDPTGKGRVASVRVSSDVLSLGDWEDYLRIPLSPGAAQRILDVTAGALMPTRKVSKAVWTAATQKLNPAPSGVFGQANKGANLAQYAEHDAYVKGQLSAANAAMGDLVAGHKKDVVLSNEVKPGLNGSVAIYGWHKKDGTAIQPLFGGHDNHWADYSHGIRLVHPTMTVDGVPVSYEVALQDPSLAPLVSDEGVIKQVRYPYPMTAGGGAGDGTIAMAGPLWPYAATLGLPGIALWAKRRSSGV